MVPPIELSVSITPENVKNLTDEELDIVVAEKQKRIAANFKESEESAERIPELESENYKYDKDKSVEEKLKNGRTKEKDPNGVVYLRKDLTPEEKDADKKAFIREYLQWVPKEFIGEQKFNLFAVDKLWLRDKLPKNYAEFKKIRGNDHDKFMQKYFSKNGKLMLSGCRSPDDEGFYNLGLREDCRLWDGDSVELDEDSFNHSYDNPRFGFSVRLLKSA